jgi:hypothetical protein
MPELDFPLNEVLPALERRWDISFFKPLTILSDGFSGAYVFYVDIKCRGRSSELFDGKAILKISSVEDVGAAVREIENYHLVSLQTDEISKRHIPSLLAEAQFEKWLVILQTFAGGGSIFSTSLNVAAMPFKVRSLNFISRDLVEHWTIADDEQEILAPEALMRRWIGIRKIDPSVARIAEQLKAHFRVNPIAPNFNILRQVVVNPLRFFRASSDATYLLRYLPGRFHGDLHDRNIIVPRLIREVGPSSEANTDNATAEYCLIDIARYSGRQPFFFDHAYLEHSIVLDAVSRLPITRWIDFFQKSIDHTRIEAPRNDDDELVLHQCKSIFDPANGFVGERT